MICQALIKGLFAVKKNLKNVTYFHRMIVSTQYKSLKLICHVFRNVQFSGLKVLQLMHCFNSKTAFMASCMKCQII